MYLTSGKAYQIKINKLANKTAHFYSDYFILVKNRGQTIGLVFTDNGYSANELINQSNY